MDVCIRFGSPPWADPRLIAAKYRSRRDLKNTTGHQYFSAIPKRVTLPVYDLPWPPKSRYAFLRPGIVTFETSWLSFILGRSLISTILYTHPNAGCLWHVTETTTNPVISNFLHPNKKVLLWRGTDNPRGLFPNVALRRPMHESTYREHRKFFCTALNPGANTVVISSWES